MNQKKQVTLNDIAQKLKISKVAVSKALRDHPDISPQTKELVKETARQMGYVPNFIARNLSAGQSRTIGLVVPKIAHHFFSHAIEAIYETAYRNHYEIIMTVSQENAHHEAQHIQTLLSMRVDGLLVSVSGQPTEKEVFDAVRRRHVPLVFFDRVMEDMGFPCVTTDDEESSYKAIRHLIDAGYTKIGHLAGYQHTSIGRNRLLGFRRALQDGTLPINEDWIIEGGFAEEDGFNGLNKMMKHGPLPEVVFAVTYPVALGVLLAAEQAGLTVPGVIDVLSFGGSSYNHFIKPSITFIDQPAREIGSQATEVLLQQISAPESATIGHIKLPGKLVICETCNKREGNH